MVCQTRGEFIAGLVFFCNWYARGEANSYRFWRFLVTGMPGARRIHSGFGVFGTSDLSKTDFYAPGDPRGGRQGPQGGARGVQSAISTPLWEISTPHWTSHIPHVCPGGVLPTMRQGLYRMAWSSNPMEASPLVLRSVTVLPRALLEVSADPPVRRRRQHNNNPACINSPL